MVSIPFLCCTPVRSSPSSVPFIEACPRPVVQRGNRQVVGHLQEDNSQRALSHKSCSTSTLSQGCVLRPGSRQKFCPTSCSALHPEHRKGYGEEERATVLHMKHRIHRITQDVEGIKDEEVLPKAKEHLTLPLKTSPRMLSKVNKLHKYSFFLKFSKKENPADPGVNAFISQYLEVIYKNGYISSFVGDSDYPHLQMRNRSQVSCLRSHRARTEHWSFDFQDCDLKHNPSFFSTNIAASTALKTQHSGYHNFTPILTNFLHQCSAFNYFKMYLWII